LRLGVAKVDITPARSLPLAGFVHRQGDSAGVVHPLYARVFFFEGEDGRMKRRALLVSADLLWWGEDQARKLCERVREIWGIRESSVVFHATHTHSGPQTSTRFSSFLGKPDQLYLQELEAKVLDGIGRAARDLESVTVERGQGECHIGINRRRRVGTEIRMAPNERGPVDPEVIVVRFRTPARRTKAILVHYACHPTTTGDNLISSEFPGVAMRRVEDELGDGVLAAYLQGCCGDIRPALIREGEFYRGSDAEVRELGDALAGEVLDVMDFPMRLLSDGDLVGLSSRVMLPFQRLPRLDNLRVSSSQPDATGEWSRLLLSEPDRIAPHVPLEMTLLDIADGLTLLAANGELVVEYGLFVKRRFGGCLLPVPYSNGMIGYIPTARQVEEGGYEAEESTIYFGLPSPFACAVETIVRDGVTKLVEERDMKSGAEPLKTETVDQLEVRVYETRQALGASAGADIATKVNDLLSEQERVRMVFAAAPSQSEALEALSANEQIDWSRVVAFHMDEYVGLHSGAPQSFGRFLGETLFDKDMPGEVHFINGTEPAAEECVRYAELLQVAPIDIVCLGIGENGHIAFNDPPVADFDDPEMVKAVELDEASRQQQVNDGLFPSIEEVPTHALTLTIPTLMSGRHLFCMVPGATKREAVRCALRGPVTTECPASVLRTHQDCILYLDTKAYDA
jgi:6-phosphogluconolactonase/glucosamine-6-phosphate isomerase/deaminase